MCCEMYNYYYSKLVVVWIVLYRIFQLRGVNKNVSDTFMYMYMYLLCTYKLSEMVYWHYFQHLQILEENPLFPLAV